MAENGKIAEMHKLVKELNRLAYQYYTLDEQSVSDAEYDLLYDRLRALEDETGIVLPDSPTQRIGDKVVSQFKKHTHLSKLWSLDKVQNEGELQAWINRLEKAVAEYNQTADNPLPQLSFVITLKFDGLTINLTYDEGSLVQAATRGTGEIGEEIINQVKTIKSLPLTIPSKPRMEIRGEALMTKQAFTAYNAKAEIPLKNLRNAAAGALRNLNIMETARRKLIAYFYDLGYWEGPPFNTYSEILDFLRELGMPVHHYSSLCFSRSEIMKQVEDIALLRDKLDFDIDGLVIAVNHLATREVLGYTVKFPRWAVAYKFPAKDATTLLKAVEWNVGRTGKVTPTALLDPVDIGGVTIKRATLNNMDDIRRKGIKEGCRVFVRRANDVIPEVTGVVEESLPGAREIAAPVNCPACGSQLIQDGVHIFCENTLSCKPQLVKSIVHFAGREAMNIEGFNEKTALQLFEELDIKSIADLYKLTAEDLLKLDKFKEKKAGNLLASIERSKKCTLDSFIYALGIPNVGKKTAIDLARAFGSLDALRSAKLPELLEIPEIGEVIASSIISFFADAKICRSIDTLLSLGISPSYSERIAADNPFMGKTVVVTGTMTRYSRSEIEQLLRDLGAKAASSVSRQTHFVIYGENAGSKLDKAKAIKEANPEAPLMILNEDMFYELLDGIK